MKLITATSVITILVVLACSSFAQSGRDTEKRAAAAEARRQSAEMHLLSVQQGISQQLEYVRGETQRLQADRTYLEKLQSKNVGDYWKVRIEALQADIRKRDAAIQNRNVTLAELKQAEANDKHDYSNACNELSRLEAIKNREMGLDGGSHLQRNP